MRKFRSSCFAFFFLGNLETCSNFIGQITCVLHKRCLNRKTSLFNNSKLEKKDLGELRKEKHEKKKRIS